MKKLFFSLLALLFCGLASAQMPQMPQLPFDTAVVKGVLPNGMTYYIQHNENPQKRAFFYIAQKVGAVQEEENQRGLAHFLEHMCFNGSEHFKGNAIVEFCQRIGVQFGADLNAYTAADRTVYNINNVPTTEESNLDSCLLILYDWSHALTLDPKEIDKERGVIHEEWRMRSSAMMRILERQLPVLMPGSRYGERLPIGLMSVVDNFKPEALRAYYEKWYRPDLQGIVIIGDIDVKKMEEKVKKLFSTIPMPKNPAKFEYYPVPDHDQPIFVVDKDKEITTPDITVMIKHDPLPRELRSTSAAFGMDYVTSIVDQLFSNRFSELSQNPDAPYNSLYAGDGEFILASTKYALQFSTTPKDGKTEEATADLLREIVRAGKYGFTDVEYARAKKQFLSNLDQAREARKKIKSAELVDECVENFLENTAKTTFDYSYNAYKQMAEAIPLTAVNQYVQELIGKLDTNVVVLATYPEREGVTVPDKSVFANLLVQAKAEDVKPYVAKTVDTRLLDREPKAGKIKKELPADDLGYKTLVLSNGIRVLYKSTDFDESKITMNAVSRGGSAMLPNQDMDNNAMFTSVMSNNGLGKFNSVDLEKALSGRQVSLAPSLGERTEALTGMSAPRDFRTFMQLVYLSFTQQNYDTLNYRNVMKNQEQFLKNRDADPVSSLRDSIRTRLYSYNPRMQPFTLERLKNVSYDGIRRIFADRFANAADFTFVFTGKIDEDSLRTFAKLYLASIPTGGKLENFKDDGVRLWKGMQQCEYTKKMETPMGYMLQMWNGRYPYSVKNDAVAEAAGRVLETIYLQNIREKYSLTYSVNTDCSTTDNPGHSFVLQTICPVKPEKADSAMMLINEGLKDLASRPAPDEYLSKVKEQMLKIYENNQRENNYWTGLELDKILYGRNNHKGEREAIESITGADIQQFIRDVVMKQQNRLNIIMLPEENK
jgi:zinc protease